jgi:hypothetical protein
VVVSAHASAKERNPAPAFATASTMLRRSRVDRASRSSRVTSRVSPAAMAFSARASSLRSEGCSRQRHHPLRASRAI